MAQVLTELSSYSDFQLTLMCEAHPAFLRPYTLDPALALESGKVGGGGMEARGVGG